MEVIIICLSLSGLILYIMFSDPKPRKSNSCGFNTRKSILFKSSVNTNSNDGEKAIQYLKDNNIEPSFLEPDLVNTDLTESDLKEVEKTFLANVSQDDLRQNVKEKPKVRKRTKNISK